MSDLWIGILIGGGSIFVLALIVIFLIFCWIGTMFEPLGQIIKDIFGKKND